MNSFERAQRNYENPPDEPEAEYCEECGKELEVLDDFGEGGKYTKCINPYCPAKFDVNTTSRYMSQLIVELEDEREAFVNLVKFLNHKISVLESYINKEINNV